jgi:hypothetical protein
MGKAGSAVGMPGGNESFFTSPPPYHPACRAAADQNVNYLLDGEEMYHYSLTVAIGPDSPLTFPFHLRKKKKTTDLEYRRSPAGFE